MNEYTAFASLYDTFMEDVPYEKWYKEIKGFFKTFKKPNITGKIAELGCGTGNMTRLLKKDGTNVIGVDISPEMLTVAKKKTDEEGLDILYVMQDFRELELGEKVDAIVSVCDCMNYVTEYSELKEVFKRVANSLVSRGLFIFDVNTLHKFRYVLSNNSYSQTTENSACTWENFFDEQTRINEYYTNFFVLDEKTGQYIRNEEFHYERGYTVEEIKKALEDFEILGIYDEKDFSEGDENAERLFFVARENKNE